MTKKQGFCSKPGAVVQYKRLVLSLSLLGDLSTLEGEGGTRTPGKHPVIHGSNPILGTEPPVAWRVSVSSVSFHTLNSIEEEMEAPQGSQAKQGC